MPEVIVLGIAQDGGVPHAGCMCSSCSAARSDPARRHYTVSLGIVSGNRFAMIDATQDFAHQHYELWSRATNTGVDDRERFPAPEAIVITHAHTGHYSGLWQLDRSVLAANDVVVYCPPKTAKLLASNEPFRAMEHERFIRIAPAPFASRFDLLPDVELELISVPHRSEWDTDTAAIAIRGPEQSVLYVPDIDSWGAWDRDVVLFATEFDVVMIDGCFWEAPPRKGVPHPPITESMDLLQPLVDAGDVRIVFTHINHSNPVLVPGSDEGKAVERRGFHIAREGDSFSL